MERVAATNEQWLKLREGKNQRKAPRIDSISALLARTRPQLRNQVRRRPAARILGFTGGPATIRFIKFVQHDPHPLLPEDETRARGGGAGYSWCPIRARASATRSFTDGAISSMNIRSRGAVGTPQRTKFEKP